MLSGCRPLVVNGLLLQCLLAITLSCCSEEVLRTSSVPAAESISMNELQQLVENERPLPDTMYDHRSDSATGDRLELPAVLHFYYSNSKPFPLGMEKRAGAPPGAGAFAHVRGRRHAAPPSAGTFIGARGRRYWNMDPAVDGSTFNPFFRQHIDAAISRKYRRGDDAVPVDDDDDLDAAAPPSGFTIVRGKKSYQ